MHKEKFQKVSPASGKRSLKGRKTDENHHVRTQNSRRLQCQRQINAKLFCTSTIY